MIPRTFGRQCTQGAFEWLDSNGLVHTCASSDVRGWDGWARWGVGWQKWTVASSTSRAAMSLGEQGRREGEGEEEGLDFCTRQIEI